MEHLSWLLLYALAWWRLASYSPIQHGETFTLTLSSSIHDHRGWQASTMRSSRYFTSLACTSFLLFFIMLMPWRYTRDITSSYYSRHTCHRFNSHMTNLWITLWTPWSPLDPLHFSKPWSQHMVQALPMDNSYKYNLIQALVHRDCH